MSDEDLSAVHSALGEIAKELSRLNTSHSELHVKVDTVHRVAKRIAADRMTDRIDVDRGLRRTRALERQVESLSEKTADVSDWRPDPNEITGSHQLAIIKAQHEDMRAKADRDEERRYQSGVWWKRTSTKWLVASIGALSLLALGGCAQYIVSAITHAR